MQLSGKTTMVNTFSSNQVDRKTGQKFVGF